MKILQIGNKILREKSKDIPLDQIKSARIRTLIHKMSETLRNELNGVGLAAIQIGEPQSVFLISKYALKENELSAQNHEELKKKKEKEEYTVFINPKIIKYSKKKSLFSEGCLSVAEKFGKVKRSTNVTVEAYDENGQKFKRGAGGLLAQVIQHEADHLNGILFVDKVEI